MRFKITFFISLFFCILSVFGQRTLKGRIIDQFFETAIGITISNKDTTEIGLSDLDGYFKIKLPKETDILIFAGVGYESATISIPKECENAEIVLFMASTYDFISPKKIDRLRKKEFDKLPELHSQAYQKGLFKTEKTCVIRTFKLDFPNLDEIRRQDKLRKKQIKTKFKELKIGDIIKVPYNVIQRHNGTDITTLNPYSYTFDGENFDCIIKGVITKKNKRKGGYNLVYRVLDYPDCNYDNMVINEPYYPSQKLKVGETIKFNMKYSKVIKNK
ncbi:carboxypeptidase-like regulatory domain-containing protein [Polaribacter uvawellassae]|uniref:carboxypeptidase-like regulatory domain-containing protein n=1 Tax=Polaribacter uvawellassae TaxID=3133495 RepID=UPI0032191E4D